MIFQRLKIQSFFIAAILIVVICPLSAQGDCPPADILNPNKTWTEISYGLSSSQTIKYSFDTIPIEIDGKTYYQLLGQHSQSPDFWHVKAYMRTEEDRIYRLGFKREDLWYDFNLISGDTFHLGKEDYFSKFVVLNLDTITIFDGSLRKRWMLKALTDDFVDTITWVEGIGNINGFLENYIPWSADWDPTFLLCVFCNEELIYDNPDYDSCWFLPTPVEELAARDILLIPNPAWEEITITGIEEPIKIVQIYNTIGRLVKVDTELQIQIDDLANGYYTAVVVLWDGTSTALRFIKI